MFKLTTPHLYISRFHNYVAQSISLLYTLMCLCTCFISPLGIYGCHVLVELIGTNGTKAHGTLRITVSAKPTVNVHTQRANTGSVSQHLSGEEVDILCVASGYPLSTIVWSFYQRKKSSPGLLIMPLFNE